MVIWYGNNFKYILYSKKSGLPKYSPSFKTREEAVEEQRRTDKLYNEQFIHIEF